ncbi:Transmembrane exosortase (Exosortase_EpsH) [Thaumarchaeota archaeon SCGC AB-539-E09]|nr:Transmembrane exosortase (Exosortase_EpsH) [Thaumarchaeota archaeon SCGC AB-539-E09]
MKLNGRVALVARVLVLILVLVALYWQDLTLVANEALKSDLATHIISIPILLAYVLFRVRKTFTESASLRTVKLRSREAILLKDVTGGLLCLLAYIIKWYGAYTFIPLELHIISLPIFTAGITLLIFNPQTLRTLLFPITFLIFLTPPPLEYAQKVGSALATFSSQAAYNVLKTLNLPVTLTSTYVSPVINLTTPSGAEIPFAIDIACSGLYSLIGFIIFATFTAYIARGPIQKKLALLALGFPIIYAMNTLRITLTVIIGYYSGPNLALNIFHLFGGWALIFIGTLILLTLAEKVLKIQIFTKTSETCLHENTEEHLCIDCGKILTSTLNKLRRTETVKLALIIAITISLAFIQVPVIALTEGAAEVFIQKTTGEQINSKILPEVESYDLRFIYRDTDFEKISGQNASLMYQYRPQNRSEQPIWVGLEIGPTKACLHPWETCLITWPQTQGQEPEVTQLDLRDIHLIENPPLSARYFAYKNNDSNVTQVILYWYTRATFKTVEGYQHKWTKTSVIEYTNDPQGYLVAEEEILPIAKTVANYWKPITTWSWMALAIAENGPILIIITLTMISATAILYYYTETKRRNHAKRAYNRISDQKERHILDAVKAIKKERANGSQIALKYREITGNDIDIYELHEKLEEAERSGLVTRKLVSIHDEPYLNWRTSF